MTTIKLYNTKTRKKEVFTPLKADDVRMYVCGPTVYDRAHIGNARPVIVFDVLYRLLQQVYGKDYVTYARNFTDVDDKINARAAETGRTIREITDETIGWYLDDMGALGNLEPDHAPRATEYIPEMVAMIELLISKGFAYFEDSPRLHNQPPAKYVVLDESKLPRHALFEVRTYEQYGRLSGRTLDEMIAGARVEVANNKRDPMDFVLWKPSGEGEPGWDGPKSQGIEAGRGRPGWHIECSAMSHKLFGKKFDIHGGGLDLAFPHHENEIAQSCACYGEDSFAQVWMHNEMLQVEGKKMSKSLGNFFSVRDLIDQGYPGEVIRFVYLGTHYRKPMDWTNKKAKEAEATLRKWRALTEGVEPTRAIDAEVLRAISDDLNTSGAISVLHQLARQEDKELLLASAQFLGLLTDEMLDPAWKVPEELETYVEHRGTVEALIAKRKEARLAKDFATSDKIRDVLLAAGVELKDISLTEVEFKITRDFNPAKLESLK
ncbi:cysteine--tRNA ligase [Neptunicoccus sediminis]|uniref:cysteine--tRNA ligase n=1 Tax=Neptunicoccus sediminis TaxID=1892596 RepID=UPI000845E41F|nr:cysteine--tRNA ligase [Neptunicoccus sediminis]